MPVSETEKRGVSSGCRFSEKAGHVPIKKRRFLLRSPSPPPVQTSPCVEETADHTRRHDISEKFVSLQSSSSDINMSQVVDTNSISVKKSDTSNKGFREDEDFSGISILAAAACNSSLGRDCVYVEDGPCIEESSALDQAREVSANTETRSSSKALSKEDVFNSCEMSCGATSSCMSTEQVGEFASISTIVNSSQKVAIVGKGLKDASLGVDSLSFAGDVSCSKDEEIARNERPSSQDHRLHWDLNVVMDAWEQPFDDPGAPSDFAHNESQDVGNSNHNENMESEGHDLRDNTETEYAAQSCLLPGEPRASANQCSVEIKDGDDMDSCSNLKQPLCLGEKFPSSNSNLNLDVMKCMIEETKCGCQEETANPNDESVVAAQTTQSSALCTLNETEDASVKSLVLNSSCIGYQPVMEGLKSDVGVSSLQVQNLASFGAVAADTDITLSVSSNSDTLKEVKQNVAVPELLERPKNFHIVENSLAEDVDQKTVEPQEHAKFAMSEDNGLPDTEAPMSERCERLVALDNKVQVVSNIQDDNIVCNNRTVNNLPEISTVTPKESCDSYHHEACNTNLDNCSNYFENIDHEESLKYKNDVGVQCHPVLVDGTDAAGELQEDYDSQYEDGELRESSGHAWEEYDAVDREAENVDYVSNYGETHIAIPSDYHVAECRQVEDSKSGRPVIAPAVSLRDSIVDNESYRKVAEANGNERGHDEGNQLKISHAVEKMEPTPGNELLESGKSFSDMATQGGDENGRNSKMPTHNDVLLDSRSNESRADHKALRRGLQSQIEAPVSRRDAYKEEQMKNRFEPGPMRSFERMRYPFHNQGRGWQSGNWDGSSDSRRGIRRHYSPIIHGHSKLDDDAVVERDDLGCVGTQRDLSYPQQFLPKSRAGVEGEQCAGFHSRYKPDRKFSPERAGGFGRGRPFRYGTFVEGRGGRGRFNGPFSDEIFQSSFKYRRPLSRRERSISPFAGRGQSNIHHSRRNSPSPSRSRSPIVWNSPRRRMGAGNDGNTFVGHRNRSPNLRFEGRMQRLRSPHQQSGFGADHAGGFRSISRNHGSPPHNRWSSARKDEQGQFRELAYKRRTSALDRSPGRIRLSGERSAAIDSSQNPKPDGYYRISDRVPDDDGRARYEENFEEKRKQYHFFRPGRRNYDDGMPSRLRQDNNDSFPMGNSFRDRDDSSFQDSRGLRGIGSRIGNVPRRFRGENQSFIYERDGKFNPNSKQFGVDVMDSPHNLKSEEQYRPNYARRFSAFNGTNRGCRYENYGDRRKQNGPANIIRRSDNEDTEKRLHHDENFKDTPEFCSRVTRGFDGRIGSLSTRLREDDGPIVCGQEEKLDDNTE